MSQKEFRLGLIMVYLYYEFAFQSTWFKVSPEGIKNGVVLL
jgi:hypothetical protein